MGVNLKKAPTAVELEKMKMVWDELRESNAYERTLHDGRMFVELYLKKLAAYLNLNVYDVSNAVSRLQHEGYIVRHAYGTPTKPSVFYIRAENKPYGEASPPPLPDGYYIPKKRKKTKPSVVRKKVEEKVVQTEEVVDVKPKVKELIIETMLPSREVPEPDTHLILDANTDFFTAGLTGILQRLNEYSDLKSRYIRAKDRIDELECEISDKNNYCLELKKKIADLEKERDGYLAMADASGKSVRTAKSNAAFVLNTLTPILSDSWSDREDADLIRGVIKRLKLDSSTLTRVSAALGDIKSLTE